jgi:hypothetical protein
VRRNRGVIRPSHRSDHSAKARGRRAIPGPPASSVAGRPATDFALADRRFPARPIPGSRAIGRSARSRRDGRLSQPRKSVPARRAKSEPTIGWPPSEVNIAHGASTPGNGRRGNSCTDVKGSRLHSGVGAFPRGQPVSPIQVLRQHLGSATRRLLLFQTTLQAGLVSCGRCPSIPCASKSAAVERPRAPAPIRPVDGLSRTESRKRA